MTTAQITREIRDGKTYIHTEYRNAKYTVVRGQFGWAVYVCRNGMGRHHFGTIRVCQSWDEVTAKYKAFAGIQLLDAI